MITFSISSIFLLCLFLYLGCLPLLKSILIIYIFLRSHEFHPDAYFIDTKLCLAAYIFSINLTYSFLSSFTSKVIFKYLLSDFLAKGCQKLSTLLVFSKDCLWLH